ncbi:hypothetical protein [Streptomyces sp. NPDC057682]|uniref:hypothetical protein n=1 Tax=Streptomyces sp. NPDC057682 TaxID=3346210 RepID=UPI0036C57148
MYLGIGASTVALLAFFGISNFDDLRQMVGSGSGSGSGVADACNAAYAAFHGKENDDRSVPVDTGHEQGKAAEFHAYAGK